MRTSELAEQVAITEQLRAERPESKEALLMHLGFLAADLRRMILHNPGCFSERQEHALKSIRMDLESCARIGGSIESYIDGTAREPMPSVMQAAE